MSKVLIVDDSADNRDFCELIAGLYQMQVEQSSNAGEALARLHEGFRPDVIVLDVMMPGMPPEEFIRNLRAHEQFNGIRVVLMSSLRDVGTRAHLMGANDWIQKPLDVGQFAATLQLNTIHLDGLSDLSENSVANSP